MAKDRHKPRPAPVRLGADTRAKLDQLRQLTRRPMSYPAMIAALVDAELAKWASPQGSKRLSAGLLFFAPWFLS